MNTLPICTKSFILLTNATPKAAAALSACFALAMTCGCSTTTKTAAAGNRAHVAPDKPQIEQAKSAVIFTWRGEPYYSYYSDWAIDTFKVNLRLRTQNAQENVRKSGVYESFQEEFAKMFQARSAIGIATLDKTNRVLSGPQDQEKVNVLASAQKQGCDLVFEATLWPRWTEHKRRNPNYPIALDDIFEHDASVKAELTVRRVADENILWKASVTSTFKNATTASGDDPDFKALAASAAKFLIKSYDEAR